MDNVTHTLAGLLIAEAALLWAARKRSAMNAAAPAAEAGRLVLLVASAVANNLPDADFVIRVHVCHDGCFCQCHLTGRRRVILCGYPANVTKACDITQ
jgi:hypothetical protein